MNILQLRGAVNDNGPGSQTLTIKSRRRGHNLFSKLVEGKLTDKIKSKSSIIF